MSILQRTITIGACSLALLVTCLYSGLAGAELLFESCKISDPTGKYSLRAECATLEVPLDSRPAEMASNGTATQSLHITRLKSRSAKSKADPFTLLAGGPGQSASESWPTVQFAFERIRKNRDIYLVDQRGTGLSGKLECPNESPDSNLFNVDMDAVKAASLACLQQLDVDPAFFTTSIAVQDLELARQAIGIDVWNIYGISYGTRVALHYLRRFPEHVRTIILDAVVPPDVALGANVALDAEAAFENLLQRCTADDLCQQQYPNLGQQTRNLIAKLREQPIPITFENFNTGQLETLDFTLNHLSLTMRMLTYTSHGVSILPNMLREAYENQNYAPFARQAAMQADQLGGSLASGMYSAVVCTEDEPFLDTSTISRDALANTYLGTDAIDALEASCDSWTPGVMDEDFRTPVVSDKPVLIFSGGADPVTPALYGERIAETLSQSLHITNPHQGHMQSVLGCAPLIMANFVTRANTDDIDYGCLERLAPEPFFVDANGPVP